MARSIYLAGPDVFLANAQEVGERKRKLCTEFGFDGLFPLDQAAAIGDDPAKIFLANCDLMRRADIGLFNLTPFRGPSADAGTDFELGFLFARGKPVFGYSSTAAVYAARVESAAGPLVARDGRQWDRDGYQVEDFGLGDNLMIERAIRESGGIITVVEDTTDQRLAAFQAFQACLKAVDERFGSAAPTGAGRTGDEVRSW